MTNWEEYLGDFPFSTAIIGDVGSGKTAVATSIIDQYKDEYAPYIVARKSVHKTYPEWMKRIDPENLRIPKDAIIFIDDIHLYYHAREWAGGKSRLLDALSRERRQVNSAIVMTTQDAAVVDINLIRMLSAIIIKKPGLMQRKYERSAIQPMLNRAYKELKDKDIAATYIISNQKDEEEVINISPPAWFTDEISMAHRDFFDRKMQNRRKSTSQGLNIVGEVFRTIGKLAT